MFYWHGYPYTNFHELNLDWVLEKVKANKDAIEAIAQKEDTAITESLERLAEEGKLDAALEAFTDAGYVNIASLDQNNLEAAIANAMEGSRGLYVAPGVYSCNITLTRDYEIVGVGKIIGKINANGFRLLVRGIQVENTENVCIHNENATGRVWIENCHLKGLQPPIHINGAKHCKISGCIIENFETSNTYPVTVYNCDEVDVANNKVVNRCVYTETHGIAVFGCAGGAAISGNHVYMNGQAFGISVANSEKSTITGNIVLNSGREAINAESVKECAIVGNVCHWDSGVSRDYGISVFGYSDKYGFESRINIIANNTIYNCLKSFCAVAGKITAAYVTGNSGFSNFVGRPESELACVTVNKDANSEAPAIVAIMGNMAIPGDIPPTIGVYSPDQVRSLSTVAFNNMPAPVTGVQTNWNSSYNIWGYQA